MTMRRMSSMVPVGLLKRASVLLVLVLIKLSVNIRLLNTCSLSVVFWWINRLLLLISLIRLVNILVLKFLSLISLVVLIGWLLRLRFVSMLMRLLMIRLSRILFVSVLRVLCLVWIFYGRKSRKMFLFTRKLLISLLLLMKPNLIRKSLR